MKILASNIIAKYKTRDPFEIAKQNNIFIINEPLGNIYGYYENQLGQKFIHLNNTLPMYYQKYVVAHLLYRVFTNPNEMLFLKKKRGLKFTDSEVEANKFAVHLTFDEEEFNSYNSLDEYFKSLNMSDEDVKDLFKRFNRVWEFGEVPSKENLLTVIKKFE